MKVGSFYKSIGILNKKININIELKDGKKSPYYPPNYPNFTDEDRQNHNNEYPIDNTNGFFTDLRGTGFMVIDADDEKAIEDFESKNIITASTNTTKGKHYYVKIEDYEFFKKDVKINGTELDFITDYILEYNNMCVNNPGSIHCFKNNQELFDTFNYTPNKKKIIKKIEKEFTNELVVSTQCINDKIEKEVLFKIIDNLDSNRFRNYKEWCSLMYCMVYQSQGNETMEYLKKTNEFLSQLDNYDEMGNIRFFMDNSNKEISSNTKLIYKWLEQDNNKLFHELTKNENKICSIYFDKLKDYKQKKEYFEKFAFKVCSKGKPVFLIFDSIDRNPNELTRDNLKNTFENLNIKVTDKNDKISPIPFIDKWLKDPYMRTYERYDFLPPPLNCKASVFNLFNGLRAENELQEIQGDGDISKILQHIHFLGGEEQKNTDFIIKMMAYKVKYPAYLPRVALIFRSEQGVGKNLLSDFFGKYIIGNEWYVCSANPDAFLGKYNCRIKGKVFAVMNEVSGKDTFGLDGKLKELITEDTIQYEAKFANSHDIKNCAMIWIYTNNDNPVPIEPSDRRLCVFDCSSTTLKLKETGYFTDLIKDMKDTKIQKTFYNYLLNYDIDDDYNFSCNRPITNAYKQMKLWNIPITTKFWKWYVSHDGWLEESDMKASFLFELFTKFLESTRTKSSLNQHQFTIKIIKNKYCSSIPGDKKHETKLKIDYDFIYSEIDKYYDLEN